METRFRTSFVPKKALAVKVEAAAHGGTIHLFFALGVLMFLIAILGSGGVYLYKTVLEKSINEKSIALEKAKKVFEPTFIRDAKRLDARIRSARELLQKHIVVSPVLTLLGDTTLQTIRFTDFAYAYGQGLPTITLKGEAKGTDAASGYASVALQSDAFGEEERVREPVFSGLKLSEKGTVQFSFTAGIDQDLLSYAKMFAPAAPVEDAPLPEESSPFPEADSGEGNFDDNFDSPPTP